MTTPSVRSRVRAAASVLLAPVRTGRGVLWAPGVTTGLGNHLYSWLWAHNQRLRGAEAAVLAVPEMEPWLEHLPAMRDLVVARRDVRWRDRRLTELWPQRFGESFTPAELAGFVRQRIATARAFAERPPADPARVVVNVRRGDYYSDPRFRGLYGFDVVEYLRAAVDATTARAPVAEIHVVSDGLDWCRARLGWLADHAERLSFAEPGQPALQDFVTVASARRLILTNSTFAYWGGYVSNVLHRDNHADVVAPWFHRRDLDGGAAFQLDPAWTVVRDIAGGWDA